MSKHHIEWLVDFINSYKDKSFIGSELKECLMKQFVNLTDSNARKIISNCLNDELIKSTKPIKFGNNEYVYYSLKATNIYEIIKPNIKKYKPQLYRAIFALKRNEGILSMNEFSNIAGVVTDNQSHNVSLEIILNDLQYLNIAKKRNYNGIEFIELLNKSYDEDYLNSFIGKLKDKNFILYQSLLCLYKCNIVDMNSICFFGEANNYLGINKNNVVWDAFGFTNTVGLSSNLKEYQTIVVVDCMHDKAYEEYDFLGFKTRVDHLIFSITSSKRKVLPIVIAKEFSPSAKSLISKNNYMCFDINTLLGKNAIEISNRYRNVISNITSSINKGKETSIASDIDEFFDYMHDNGTEYNYNNLKGHLFEYMMYPVFLKIFNERDTRIHKNYSKKFQQKEFECDFFIEKEDENVFIELKGYKKDYVIPFAKINESNEGNVDKQTVKWFIVNTYELAKKAVNNGSKNSLCYITTGSISDEAKQKLLSRKKDKPKQMAIYYEREELIELLKVNGFKKEINIIEKYYV